MCSEQQLNLWVLQKQTNKKNITGQHKDVSAWCSLADDTSGQDGWMYLWEGTPGREADPAYVAGVSAFITWAGIHVLVFSCRT